MEKSNAAVAEKFIHDLGRCDADAMQEAMTDDVVAVARGTSAISGSRTRDEILDVVKMFSKVSESGLNPVIVSSTAEGDRVVVEWEGYCTLKDGTPYNNQYVTVFQFRDGLISRFSEYFCTTLADTVVVPVWQKLIANA
jgi:ketosteroid isomerase-like protein